jgi:hypothetical protein
MTTVMLVSGMMPIALGQGAGSAARSAMAKVIVGGQALSLLLTLLVTPVAYTLFDDFAGLFRRKPQAAHPTNGSPPPPPPAHPEPRVKERPAHEPALPVHALIAPPAPNTG